jgi:hypothetical protein
MPAERLIVPGCPFAGRVAGAALDGIPTLGLLRGAGPRQGDRVRAVSAAIVAVPKRAHLKTLAKAGTSIVLAGPAAGTAVLARTGRQGYARTAAPRRGALPQTAQRQQRLATRQARGRRGNLAGTGFIGHGPAVGRRAAARVLGAEKRSAELADRLPEFANLRAFRSAS